MAFPAQLPDPTILRPWLQSLGYEVQDATSLAGDVSPRRYFRLDLGDAGVAILAYYPSNLREACDRFAKSTELLQGSSVPVPSILGSNRDAGFMLLEDLGESTLYDRRNEDWDALLPYFEESISLLKRIRSIPAETVRNLNPPLDRELLVSELRQTWEIFLTPRGLVGDSSLRRSLWQALEQICARLTDETVVVCHRDYMARNLVPLSPAPKLGVLDHQDMRLGPAFYDLASLLNDSLFPPPEIEGALVSALVSDESERLAYRRAAVQRTIKAVGTFEAFARRGNAGRLHLVPATLGRALYHLRALPEGEGLTDRLSELWQPIVDA